MRNKENSKRKIANEANKLGKLIEEYSDTLLYNEMLELTVSGIMKPLLIKDSDKSTVLGIAVKRAMKEE